MIVSNKVFALVKKGDEFARSSDWQRAQDQYQQALTLAPKDPSTLYGMAECSQATGNIAKAIDYSRQAIYHNGSVAEGFCENIPDRLMPLALLLNQTGQAAEAVSVYNHAAYQLNYQDSENHEGKPNLDVLLPEFSANQETYTPKRLQALAEVGIAITTADFSEKVALARLQQAVAIDPDSAVAYYYLGSQWHGTDDTQAKAAFARAKELGDAQVNAATDEALKNIH